MKCNKCEHCLENHCSNNIVGFDSGLTQCTWENCDCVINERGQ